MLLEHYLVLYYLDPTLIWFQKKKNAQVRGVHWTTTKRALICSQTKFFKQNHNTNNKMGLNL